MNSDVLVVKAIKDRIINLAGRPPAILAQDVAEIYEVEARQVGQAVKRNPTRFPEPEFCFRLTDEEWAEILKSQNATSSWGGARKLPLAFTEPGCNQLSAVLKSAVAAERSVHAMRAFSLVSQAMRGDRAAAKTLVGGMMAAGSLPAPPADHHLVALESMGRMMELVGKTLERFDARMERLEANTASAAASITAGAKTKRPSPAVEQVAEFVRQNCRRGVAAAAGKDRLYRRYCDWCNEQVAPAYNLSAFFRAIYQAAPGTRPALAGPRSKKRHIIIGLALATDSRQLTLIEGVR